MAKNFSIGLISFLVLLLVGCGLNTPTPKPLSISSTTPPVNNSPEIFYLGTRAPVTLIEEKEVNSYLIRDWRDTSYYLDTITIEKDGSIKFQSTPWSRYKILDINHDGQSEIIIWQYGGGNHGTYQVQGFETDADLTKILDSTVYV